MDTILITGGAGFIGSMLANYLGKENKIVVVDDLSMGKKENLDMEKRVTFIEGECIRSSIDGKNHETVSVCLYFSFSCCS